MGLDAFNLYLEECTFTNVSMNDIKMIKWDFNTIHDELFIDYHTSYLKTGFIEYVKTNKIKEEHYYT
jgi:D-alanine-D-alanine ligase-like ATP-grasp enzyme